MDVLLLIRSALNTGYAQCGQGCSKRGLAHPYINYLGAGVIPSMSSKQRETNELDIKCEFAQTVWELKLLP